PTAPAAETSRAGSLAGEGRERPGRAGVDAESGEVGPDDPTETETDREAGADTGTGTDPTGREPTGRPSGNPYDRDDPDAGADADPVTRPGAGDGPVLRALPLGSGLILIGLGLGLAFVALRVRRS
ncbi:hypothetical protein FNH04_21535, partial [Streptomyces phyllanthi]